MMMTVQQTAPFSGLLPVAVSRYSFPAVAKSAAGRRNPSYSMATPDAPCVFFCVYAYVHLLFTHRFFSRCCIRVMVAQAGQPSGWPVFIEAGIPTPVRVTTHERRNSGGGNNRYSMEAAIMATILTPSHPQFVFVFAAVRRADRKPRICMLRTVAGDEHAARRSLVRDYVLSFAGRLPVAEVRA
ncbi:host cell division inhibitor Icd-like protein [Enterobacter hormaechei]|uniref:host cell division inhibitor Icd-like protein n=1 Tax=Enterobacter cloacae complex TaxID=354276 RepID=UPI000F8266C7|nr:MULTISPECIES: host cell division inhibitor Icd-like protein [Enterobacter cloacae complex]HDC4547671.1 ash family protein [Enterobacter cloacae]HED9537897.1 ash family protein [Klebsiella pneumoniae]EKS6318721.1 ash family protein [Enterobacter hormaechei]ELD3279070.1 ash family protein [Enterobacter hormaechei]MBJ6539365.1 ash family protein [Enterobacter hormaechei]